MTLQFFNKIFNLGSKSTVPLDFGGFKLGAFTAVKKVLEFFGYPLNLTNIPTATTLAGYKIYGNSVQLEVPEGYTIKDYILMTTEEAEEQKEKQQKQQRNKEIEEKIKELQIMSLPEILNGNTENIKLYNEVIAGLNNAKL